jgi:phosphoribosylformylglycinamidine synthase
MAEACKFFETPITGGNVSLYNETLGEAIFPSPVMGIVGVMKTARPTPMHFQASGRTVILLGGIGDTDPQRFGGTQYTKVILDDMWGLPPALDMDYEKRVQEAVRRIVLEGLAESAHDLSDGGLAVAVAESCFGVENIGAKIDLDSDLKPELLLFHEGPSRILISTEKPESVERIAQEYGVRAPRIGATIDRRIEIGNRSDVLLSSPIADLKSGWENALEEVLHHS